MAQHRCQHKWKILGMRAWSFDKHFWCRKCGTILQLNDARVDGTIRKTYFRPKEKGGE